jgi:hypothetical protein
MTPSTLKADARALLAPERSRRTHLRAARRPSIAFAAAVLLATGTGWMDLSLAHGFAGKRFFPATLATEDPFVADELSLPTVSRRRTEDDGVSSIDSSASVDFSKRLTSDFGVGFGASWLRLEPRDGTRQQGWDNFALNAKYQFFKSDLRETVLSVGVDADLGGTGARRVGAESFSTITPAVLAGRGFGDLPEELRFLRPFALTGSVGLAIPSRSSSPSTDDEGNLATERHPHVLAVGFAIEYSLPYLHAFVKDLGWPAPLRNAIPIVEVALEKPVDRGRGPTTGTINPGILFPGRTMQLGIEAVVPINSRTGGGTGLLLQLHFFLDDLFPKSLGKPVFGRPTP